MKLIHRTIYLRSKSEIWFQHLWYSTSFFTKMIKLLRSTGKLKTEHSSSGLRSSHFLVIWRLLDLSRAGLEGSASGHCFKGSTSILLVTKAGWVLRLKTLTVRKKRRKVISKPYQSKLTHFRKASARRSSRQPRHQSKPVQTQKKEMSLTLTQSSPSPRLRRAKVWLPNMRRESLALT